MASPAHTDAPAAAATDLDGLVARVLAGDPGAWEGFVARVHPLLLEIGRSRRFVGGFGAPEDVAADVALRAFDRIRDRELAALRAFVDTKARYPDASFARWLAVVAGNAYVDHLRSLPEYQRRRVEGQRRLERLRIESLDGYDAPAAAVDPLTAVEVGRILDCVASDLFPEPQRAAIVLWLRGFDAAEIATELDLETADDAQKLLNAARQRLRRAVLRGGR